MTTRPRPIPFDRRLLPGLLAVALFAIIAGTVLASSFPDPQGLDGVSTVVAIGNALLGLTDEAGVNVENFLVALVLIAIVLDAALDGALMLASREGGDEE